MLRWYCAIIILVAFVILWVLGWMGVAPSGEVLRWGKIVVGLLCLIVIVGWLLSALGVVSDPSIHLLR